MLLLRKLTLHAAAYQEKGGDWGHDLDEWQADEIRALDIVRERELQRRIAKTPDGPFGSLSNDQRMASEELKAFIEKQLGWVRKGDPESTEDRDDNPFEPIQRLPSFAKPTNKNGD
ncbi:MAG: hypothetical protein FWD62_15750 [Betaproteobacteria bacterium]|nr:hypothetical protein [Betaproteobacteria bacterium]